MAIKMRVLYNSGKKGMAQFANAVKEKYDLPVNAVSGKFPPEYPLRQGAYRDPCNLC